MKKSTFVLCGAMVLASLALTAVLYPQLPPTIPVHWDAAGQVNGHAPRWAAFLLGPGLMAALLALFAALPWLSPRRMGVTAFRDSYGQVAAIVVGMAGYAHALILLAGAGNGAGIDVPRAALGGAALGLALVGNLMGKVRKNFWIGIRTPWTLASDKVWYLTHRLAGKSIVGASLLCLVLLLAGARSEVIVAVLIAGPVIPALYSLACYKRLERAGE